MKRHRYSPVFAEDQANTFTRILIKNDLFVDRTEALAQRDKVGNAPVSLLILTIRPVEKKIESRRVDK